MHERHVTDTQLADLEEGRADTAVVAHVRCCDYCRSRAAEYGWLRKQVESTLTLAAEGAHLPHPCWGGIQQRLQMARARRLVGLRASAVVGCALALCVLLALSPVWSPSVSQPPVSLAKAALPQVVLPESATTTAFVPMEVVPTRAAMACGECAPPEAVSTATSTTAPSAREDVAPAPTTLPPIPTPVTDIND